MGSIFAFLVAAMLSNPGPESVNPPGSEDISASANSSVATSPLSIAEQEPDTIPEDKPPVRLTKIPKDMPIHLMVLNEVSSRENKPGQRFKLRVNMDVIVNNQVVIPAGTRAWGELLETKSAGNAGRSGSLSAKLLYIELGDHQIPIYGGGASKGRAGTAETVVGVLALGPFGLFAKGNDAKIKAGEKMVAFVEKDTNLPLPEVFDD